MTTLAGARVVVTGAAGGIGTAIAQMFCDEQACVAGIDIRDASTTASLCGPLFRAYTADVGDPSAIRAVFGEIDEWFDGQLNVLCNVAAIGPEVAFVNTDVEVVDRVFAVNFRGPFVCSQQAVARMASGGRIIHITSTESVQAFALQTAYGASKAALTHLTKGMAVELAGRGILVNAVGPGACETPALSEQMESPRIAEHDLERTPAGRWGRPEEMAVAVRFLARDATWMTGQTIYVDGGWLACGLPFFPEIADIRRRLPGVAPDD